jgi:hypothetical protein
MEERDAYIRQRIALHSACDFAMETDGELPDCTPEEMWEKPTVWAIKKKGMSEPSPYMNQKPLPQKP